MFGYQTWVVFHTRESIRIAITNNEYPGYESDTLFNCQLSDDAINSQDKIGLNNFIYFRLTFVLIDPVPNYFKLDKLGYFHTTSYCFNQLVKNSRTLQRFLD